MIAELDFNINLQNTIYLLAFLIFLNARRLVRSAAAFYVAGVLIGLLTSTLLFGYVIQRIIPLPRFSRIPFFFGGWPISLWIYYWTWTNFGLIFQDYYSYAMCYLCFFTFVSLAVCYRIGPPVDVRTLNLAEWSLQILSIAAIYFTSQTHEYAVTSIVVLIFFSLLRRDQGRMQKFLVKKWNRFSDWYFGPQPRRLLSEEEYLNESQVCTRMELEKLKQFCQSQDSRTNWRLVSRLHKPNRMASFITGDNEHVSPEEMSIHSECYDYDDEDEEELENSANSNADDYITDDE